MKLTHGSHTDTDGRCPVLAAYGRHLNDAMGDAFRARYLADFAPRLVGTRSTPEVERRRAYVLADHAVRAFAPLALHAAGLTDEADKLRALPPFVYSASTVDAIYAGVNAARAAADAAAYTAADAAFTAARAATAAYTAFVDDDADYAAIAGVNAAFTAAYAARAGAWEGARTALIAALEVQQQPGETLLDAEGQEGS